jgi:hypothetical protein
LPLSPALPPPAGRVKTLHPKIHGGLLGVRGNAAHEADMAAHGIAPIDLVVVNLYAFEATVAKVCEERSGAGVVGRGGESERCSVEIDATQLRVPVAAFTFSLPSPCPCLPLSPLSPSHLSTHL